MLKEREEGQQQQENERTGYLTQYVPDDEEAANIQGKEMDSSATLPSFSL